MGSGERNTNYSIMIVGTNLNCSSRSGRFNCDQPIAYSGDRERVWERSARIVVTSVTGTSPELQYRQGQLSRSQNVKLYWKQCGRQKKYMFGLARKMLLMFLFYGGLG